MKFFILSLFVTFFSASIFAQENYIRQNEQNPIIVKTSHDYQLPNGYTTASGYKTITEEGLDGPLIDASRFLAQATLGSNRQQIEEVVEMGFESWIQEQFATSPTYYSDVLTEVYDQVYEMYLAEGGDPNDFRCRPKWYHANYAWWQMIMTSKDHLRQRIALALSEIIVISKESALENYGWGVANFYDIFLRHAFGNYRDILQEVTYHPAMGNYLSHLNNPKTDLERLIYPDENYARELMQLFSLGVYLLHPNGTIQKDSDGIPLETYTNDEIDDLAKVFTGFGGGGTEVCGESFAPAFGLDIRKIDMTVPMVIYPEQHEPGEKVILDQFTIPAGLSPEEEVDLALDHIFDHPNVGPFISKKLIQFLVTSNPSAEYVERVAAVFDQNEAGVRGDMQSVIQAILLDEEARSCDAMTTSSHGKLREPILRYTHFAKAMSTFVPEGRYWDTGQDFYESTQQLPLHAPSVFNFFQPDHAPSGLINDQGLVAPEFQILNSVTGLEYFNVVNDWTFREELFEHRETGSNREVYLDVYPLMGLAGDPEVLMNELDMLLTHGQLQESSRSLLRDVLQTHTNEGIAELYERTLLALYFVMTHPDYTIFK